MSSDGLDQATIALQRRNILDRARAKRIEIRQIFTDAERWNTRYPEETPMDIGPGGEVARILAGEPPEPV